MDALPAELTNTFNGYSQLDIVAKKRSPGARAGWKPGLGYSVGPWAGYSVSALASSSGNTALMIVTSPRVPGRRMGV